MYAELSTLDTFFTQTVAPTHSRDVSATSTEVSDRINPVDSNPQNYDNKVPVILKRGLANSPSNQSFQAALTDSISGNIPQSGSSNGYKQQLSPQHILQPGITHLGNVPAQNFGSSPYRQFSTQQQVPQAVTTSSPPSDSRYTIGTRFYNHLRRGHNSNPSNVISPTYAQTPTSPSTGAPFGTPTNYYNTHNQGQLSDSSNEIGFTQAYRVFSDPSSESEENLELYVSRSGPFSINNPGYDVDQYSIGNENPVYSSSQPVPQFSGSQSQLVQPLDDSLQPQDLATDYDNVPGEQITSSVYGKDNVTELKSPTNAGGNGNLFKLESLLKATTLGKGKRSWISHGSL